jgi:hypothetical protein
MNLISGVSSTPRAMLRLTIRSTPRRRQALRYQESMRMMTRMIPGSRRSTSCVLLPEAGHHNPLARLVVPTTQQCTAQRVRTRPMPRRWRRASSPTARPEHRLDCRRNLLRKHISRTSIRPSQPWQRPLQQPPRPYFGASSVSSGTALTHFLSTGRTSGLTTTAATSRINTRAG